MICPECNGVKVCGYGGSVTPPRGAVTAYAINFGTCRECNGTGQVDHISERWKEIEELANVAFGRAER